MNEKIRQRLDVFYSYRRLFIFIILFFLLVGCATIIRYNVRRVNENLKTELHMALSAAQMTLPPAIWQFNYDYLETYLAGLLLKDRIVYLGIMVEGNQLVKKAKDPYEDDSFDFFRRSSGFLCKTGPVISNKKKIAVIQIVMTRKGIYRDLVLNVIGTTWLMIFIILVIFVSYVRLRQSEKKYRSLYENTMEGIFRSTMDGCLISAFSCHNNLDDGDFFFIRDDRPCFT